MSKENQVLDSAITKDVMDKVLAMFDQLSGVIGYTSSELWRIYIIQSYRMVVADILWACFCAGFIYISFRLKNTSIKN